ncbi:MAG: ATP-binding protein [Planctomycetota bacterium]|jgi:NAD-dependent dihydropyrimidine dehydrogenase PreA subunit
MSDSITMILSRDRTVRPGHEKLERELVEKLGNRPGLQVTVIPHLYDLAPDGPAMKHLQSVAGDMVVLAWLYPRSAYWVLDANCVQGRLSPTFSMPDEETDGASGRPAAEGLPDRSIWCFDLRTHGHPEPYVAAIEEIVEAAVPGGGDGEPARAVEPVRLEESDRSRWYPVIDYDRCNNCLECLNFCLFGVFGLDGSAGITAEQPDACRLGCPACARICPAGAIMFPEHQDPAIAGDPKASPQSLKLDLSQLFGGVGVAELAAAERDRALAEKQREEQEAAAAKRDPSAVKDELDRLVDEVDELDL